MFERCLPDVFELIDVVALLDDADEVLVAGGVRVGALVELAPQLMVVHVLVYLLVDKVRVTQQVDRRLKHWHTPGRRPLIVTDWLATDQVTLQHHWFRFYTETINAAQNL